MIGDSITAGGEWSEIFSQTKIANRGIGGDRAEDILRRMEPIFAVNAKKAFVMVGINDIFRYESINTIFNNYTNIVQQLRSKGTEVYIQSTLECSKSRCGNKLEKARELNEKLKAYAAQHEIAYININNGLTSETEGLLKEYTPDGIHLLGSGYLKWSKTISPYVYSK
ncbi:MAG: lipolytic protein [Syntrophaceae bacterium]|nr:MAG: lipolytic protein [Syntrophaceae bacterium]